MSAHTNDFSPPTVPFWKCLLLAFFFGSLIFPFLRFLAFAQLLCQLPFPSLGHFIVLFKLLLYCCRNLFKVCIRPAQIFDLVFYKPL